MPDIDRLTEIRARLDAATAGPWEAQEFDDLSGDEHSGVLAGTGASQKAIAASIFYPWHDETAVEADAKFIAHAREDIPWLLDQLAAAQRKLDIINGEVVPDSWNEEVDASPVAALRDYELAMIPDLEIARDRLLDEVNELRRANKALAATVHEAQDRANRVERQYLDVESGTVLFDLQAARDMLVETRADAAADKERADGLVGELRRQLGVALNARDRARADLDQIRDLHNIVDHPVHGRSCSECSEPEAGVWVMYPCASNRAAGWKASNV